MKDMTRKVHLVRHGESKWNSERRVQKNTDGVPLSDRGRRQAQLLGARLETVPFDHVFCSDVQRAAETARIALGESYPIGFSSELREIALGAWEGRLVSEIEAETPGIMERWFKAPSTVEIDGAEKFFDFHRRVVDEVERITGSTSGDLLIISHGGVICTWLTYILGMDQDGLWSFSLPNASISTVMLEFRPRLRLLGDANHLTDGSLGFDGMPSSVG
ncbi:MAG: histidine phosphatase family protein [Candidatus Krumholzibacteriota bacterium]|nr:histidine phosphatase family protein [Candidatus Krumholzibacteriota bacterium]